jgi:predicted ArsR family transcriptional regulator
MTKDESIRLGDMAAHLLDDEAAQAVLKSMELEYIRAWRASDPADTDERERLFAAVQAVDGFREHLRIFADNGKFERAQLEKLRSQNLRE